MRATLLLAALLLAPVWGEEPLPGHSHQGHAFNEGPRHPTSLFPGNGNVHLPITTTWAQGQAYFNQGLGQLHGFWYYEAERSFRTILAHDPECAMAYWGLALANWENESRAQAFIKKATPLTSRTQVHEKLYIDAQANYLDGEPKDAKKRRQELLHDLENLIHQFPDDLEAKAFLAVRIWQFSRQGLPITSHEAVDALLQQIFARAPKHPAHHYAIHLWDEQKAARALDSAAILSSTAPAIAHMWHMPAHIYDKLHRYEESAWHQQASARIDHAHMAKHLLLPDQIFNYAHNNEWLARNWIHLGNPTESLAMAKSLLANPRHPKLNSLDSKAHSYRYGRLRLVEALEKFELWPQALELSATEWLEPLAEPKHELPRLRLLALAHFHLDHRPELENAVSRLDSLVATTEQKRDAAREEARTKVTKEGKKPKEIECAVKKAAKPHQDFLNKLGKTRTEFDGLLATLDQQSEQALAALGKSSRPKHALALQYLALDDREKAEKLSREALEKRPRSTLPLAARIEVLHALGKDEDARATFTRLREVSSRVELSSPPFARLEPIARAFGLPSDWRQPRPLPPVLANQPALDSLGPLHWTPPPAPSFTLPDHQGTPYSLDQAEEGPLLLVFFLGHDCLHCIEQLTALAGRYPEFEKAKLPILAISTDPLSDLAKAHTSYSSSGGKLPFPLLADPGFESFRRYHAYDDFEKQPLHGTFLLDRRHRLLWSDVSADPFMDLDFLLAESSRLLKLHRE